MWKKVKLGDVCEIVAGQSPTSNTYNQEKKGIPFFQGKADFGLIYPTVRYWCTSPIKISEPNDILFSLRAPVGPTNINNIKACIGRGLAAIRTSSQINLKYLSHYLRSNEKRIAELGTGSTFKAITIGMLKEVEIPLPPLPIQEKIAEILDKADELRRKDQDLQAKYDELAQAIFIDMFGDPVRNEKGWDKALLKEFYKNGVKCGPFGSALKKEEFKQNGVPVWNMDNIQSFEFLDLPSLFVSEEKYISLKQYEVVNGDIIISRAGTVGKMCVVDSTFKKSLLSTNLIKLSLDDCMLKSLFFVYLMKFFSKRLGRLKTGGEDGFTHMNTGVLNNLEIYVPPIHLQEAFAKKIELINQLKAQTNAEKSEQLFQSLLQKAFKGELVG